MKQNFVIWQEIINIILAVAGRAWSGPNFIGFVEHVTIDRIKKRFPQLDGMLQFLPIKMQSGNKNEKKLDIIEEILDFVYAKTGPNSSVASDGIPIETIMKMPELAHLSQVLPEPDIENYMEYIWYALQSRNGILRSIIIQYFHEYTKEIKNYRVGLKFPYKNPLDDIKETLANFMKMAYKKAYLKMMNENAAFIETKSNLEQSLINYGKENYFVSSDSHSLQLGLIQLNDNYPYNRMFQRIVNILFQSGITENNAKTSIDEERLLKDFYSPNEEEPDYALTIDQLMGLIIVLVWGYTISCLVFIGEIFIYNVKKVIDIQMSKKQCMEMQGGNVEVVNRNSSENFAMPLEVIELDDISNEE